MPSALALLPPAAAARLLSVVHPKSLSAAAIPVLLRRNFNCAGGPALGRISVRPCDQPVRYMQLFEGQFIAEPFAASTLEGFLLSETPSEAKQVEQTRYDAAPYSPHLNQKDKMKAIRVYQFGGPEVLQLEETSLVDVLAPNQVLIRVMYAGVNPVETYIREGQYSRLPELPYTPGGDAAGYVHAVGSAVSDLKVGQRVFATGRNTGSYAEYLVSESSYAFPLHERLSFAQGAALGTPYFTAYKALIMGANAKPGETVLVHGASGAVGTAAVQIARALGATVVGTAGTKDGMDVVTKCGAHHVFNHNHKNYEKKMVEHIGGEGFDVIIEHLANINLGHDVQMLKEGARVMVVGCRGAVNINPRHLMLPEASIKGVALGIATAEQYNEMGCAIVAGIEAGWIKPVINKEYSMAEVQQVHNDIIHSKGAKGKLVLKVADA